MNINYDLNKILAAIEEINTKKKNKTISPVSKNIINVKEHTSTNEGVLPNTEKLILEAEKHSNNFKKNTLVLETRNEDVLILDKEYNEENSEVFNSEQINNNIIDNLYLSLSKKVKKNTLKTIYELHQKINYLEKKVEFLNINNINENYSESTDNSKLSEDEHLITNEHLISEEHLINADSLEEHEGNLIDKQENDLSEDTIKTLKLQNSLIKNLEKNEEKLRLKIVDLEQDITLLTNNKINITHDNTSNKNENNLKQSASKIKQESIFYKENYERLVVENSDIKKKLLNAKKQISVFEQNIEELEDCLKNLNNILSKNSIIKINELSSKEPLVLVSSDKNQE